jgi:hypothetical protein
MIIYTMGLDTAVLRKPGISMTVYIDSAKEKNSEKKNSYH